MRKKVIFSLLFFLFSAYLFAGRRALIIGIDHYKLNNRYGGKLDITGCTNDAVDLKSLLTERFDFNESEIRLLLNHEATRESILEGFRWLVEETEPQDWIFVSYAGHGTQISDSDGDEEDGKDEGICPYNIDPVKRLNIISDDEINEFVKQLKDRRAFFLFDSCHSGTIKRGRLSKTSELRQAGYFARLLPPASLLKKETRYRGDTSHYFYAESERKSRFGVDFAQGAGEIVVFSAAAPHQVAIPVNVNTDHPNGAMTYSVLRGLEGGADKNHDGVITYRELHEFSKEYLKIVISRDLKVIKFEQDPQIDAEPEKIEDPVFFLTPQAELSNLINPYSTFNIDLRLHGKPLNQVKLKEYVAYYVESEESGYLYLYAISVDGEVTCLLPNLYQRENYIKAGEGMIVPPPEANFRIEAVEPPGKMRILAIVTKKPLDLDRFCGGREEELLHTLGSDELKELVRSTRGITRALTPSEWAAAVTELEIIK